MSDISDTEIQSNWTPEQMMELLKICQSILIDGKGKMRVSTCEEFNKMMCEVFKFISKDVNGYHVIKGMKDE